MQRKGYREMLQDMIRPKEQLLGDEEVLPTLTATQPLDLCDDTMLHPEMLLMPDTVSSCSWQGSSRGGTCNENCRSNYENTSFTSPISSVSMGTSVLAALLDSTAPEKNTKKAGATFCYAPPDPITPVISSFPSSAYMTNNVQTQFDPRESILNECASTCSSGAAATRTQLSRLPSSLTIDEAYYMGLNQTPPPTSCSFTDPIISSSFFPGSINGLSTSAEVMYPSSSCLLASDEPMQKPEVGYCEESTGLAFYKMNTLQQQHVSSSSGMQVVGDNSAPLPSDTTTLDESTFKVGRISTEERKEKINRYLKKRNERNFGKKIKYACRKTLADSRPRVRGRFARNDDYGEVTSGVSSGNHDDEDDGEVIIKENDTSLDIFSRIKSYRNNYAVESWMLSSSQMQD